MAACGRVVVLFGEDICRLSHAGRRTSARGGPLCRFQRKAQYLARPADQRRNRRTRGDLRSGGAARSLQPSRLSLSAVGPAHPPAVRSAASPQSPSLGELIAEKAGVLNLGVEGMMLVGAVAGFAVSLYTGNPAFAFAAAAGAGVLLSLVFAFLTLTMLTNQVATGLALTLFGIGLSASAGHDFVGAPIEGMKPIDVPGLSDLPVVGPLIFHYDIMVSLSLVLLVGVQWFLGRTHAGLKLRAVGE